MTKYFFSGFFFPTGLQAFQVTRRKRYAVEANSFKQAYVVFANELLQKFPDWQKYVTAKQLYSLLLKSKGLHCLTYNDNE